MQANGEAWQVFTVRRGSENLIAQLLALTRLEPGAWRQESAEVDVGKLVRSVVVQMSVRAELNGIDLGAEGGEGITLQADPEQLAVLLNNLVQNALRHTDRGGREEQELEEPPGSGLGLSIVKAIADRHQASVALHTAPGGRGLEVRVTSTRTAPLRGRAVRNLARMANPVPMLFNRHEFDKNSTLPLITSAHAKAGEVPGLRDRRYPLGNDSVAARHDRR